VYPGYADSVAVSGGGDQRRPQASFTVAFTSWMTNAWPVLALCRPKPELMTKLPLEAPSAFAGA
jgi:hypothetical protein